MTGGGALRSLRALALAAVTLGSGVAGHVASGGPAPSSPLLLALVIVLTGAFAPWLAAPASTPRVLAMSALGQAVLHVLLEQVAGGHSPGPAAHPMHMSATGPVQMPLPGPAASVAAGHLGMFLAHALAATVVAIWLAAGERAVWHAMLLAVRPVRGAWRRLRDLAAGSTAPRRRCRTARRGYVGGARPLSWTGRRSSPRAPPRWLVA